MLKINRISFQGVKKSQENKTEKQTQANSQTHKQISKLPDNSAEKNIKPILPSDYINGADLKRYKKVQKEWAKMFSEKTGIPYENIIARLPEITKGDFKKMSSNLGQFCNVPNIIEMNPVREVANLRGGGTGTTVHESVHGYLHNLRRAYARQISFDKLCQDVYLVVVKKMIDGENKFILKGYEKKEIDGVVKNVPKPMFPPQLSTQERMLLVNSLKKLEPKLIIGYIGKLNEHGINTVKTNIIPHLSEYKKTLIGTPQEVEEKCLQKITDYINSFFCRRNLLISNLTSKDHVDLKTNIETPLSETEKVLAKESLEELLYTKEGSILINLKLGSFLDIPNKSYFMSYEEKLARRQDSEFRLNKINQKIETIKTNGLNPAKKLLKEKQILENNLNLLDLADELQIIERKIIHAPKDQNKLIQIGKIVKNAADIQNNNPEFTKIRKYIKELNLNLKGKTVKERNLLIRNNLPPEKVYLFNLYLEYYKNLAQYNKLNVPYKLLANTKENKILKTDFLIILDKIKKISMDCDLSALPKMFFRTKADYIKYYKNSSQIITKWKRRLK